MDHITSTLSTTPGPNTGLNPASQQTLPVQQQGGQGNVAYSGEQTGFGQDQVTLSAAGQELSRQQGQNEQVGQQTATDPTLHGESTEKNQSSENNLSQTDLQKVQDLKKRDSEVRAHEAAHLATAGQYAAGGPSYSYQQGPDGKRYAVGGEVPINVGKERTPEETIQKMQVVRRAAMAPANPSGADRQIAAQATQNEAQARQELQSERLDPGISPSAGTHAEDPSGKGTVTPDTSDSNHSSTGIIDLAA